MNPWKRYHCLNQNKQIWDSQLILSCEAKCNSYGSSLLHDLALPLFDFQPTLFAGQEVCACVVQDSRERKVKHL